MLRALGSVASASLVSLLGVGALGMPAAQAHPQSAAESAAVALAAVEDTVSYDRGGVQRLTTARLLDTRPGSATIGGNINLYDQAGQTHLIADVLGWFPERTGTTTLALSPGTMLNRGSDIIEATWDTPSSGHAVLSGTGDVPPVGGHLSVLPSPSLRSGFLGRVTAVASGPGGTTTVQVAPAKLQDAFIELIVDTTFDGPIAGAASPFAPRLVAHAGEPAPDPAASAIRGSASTSATARSCST